MEEGKESVKDLVVEVSSSEVSIALMENHRLIEFNKESVEGHSFSVGDVYLGKVKKLLPALNAAFVDIGDEKEAFIHYLDLGLYFNAFDEFVKRANPNADLKGMYSHIKIGAPLEKEGRIEKVLTPGQLIIVQIVKEPISTKGSRLTAEISLAGRNIVLLPFADKVSISQKIASKEERRRLETLVKSIFHALNQKAIARRYAKDHNKKYEDLNLIVVHLGGGVSVGVHQKGLVIDVNQALDGEGPFSPERTGSLPVNHIINACFSGKYTKEQIKKMIVGEGGFVAYLGTNDAYEVETKAKEGSKEHAFIQSAMAYQVAKEIGDDAWGVGVSSNVGRAGVAAVVSAINFKN